MYFTQCRINENLKVVTLLVDWQYKIALVHKVKFLAAIVKSCHKVECPRQFVEESFV